jgi:hypothetical protein
MSATTTPNPPRRRRLRNEGHCRDLRADPRDETVQPFVEHIRATRVRSGVRRSAICAVIIARLEGCSSVLMESRDSDLSQGRLWVRAVIRACWTWLPLLTRRRHRCLDLISFWRVLNLRAEVACAGHQSHCRLSRRLAARRARAAGRKSGPHRFPTFRLLVEAFRHFQLPITWTTRADPRIGEILSRKNHL